MKAIEIPGHVVYGDSFRNIIDNLKTDNLKFYQFYNTEVSPGELFFFKYLNEYGDKDQEFWDRKVMNKTFYDIETRFDPKKAPDPISVEFEITSIAYYNNINNTIYIDFLRNKSSKFHQLLDNAEEFKKEIEKIYKESCEKNKMYDIKNLEIVINVFDDEATMIINFFKTIEDIGTLFLIGFNSSRFDDPYTINRLIKLIGEENAFKIISNFSIKKYGQITYEIADRTAVDILKLYQPVDSGGSGMGKSLPNYKLDTIAEVELKINKLDLEGDFNKVYLENPARFAAYNMLDVILTVKLDEKLQFVEQLYAIAKYNNASVKAVFIGRSFIFNYRNTKHYLVDKNQLIRNNKFNKEIYYVHEEKENAW